MGFFDFIKSFGKRKQSKIIPTFPNFFSTGQTLRTDLLSYDTVQQAIMRICNEVKKLKPLHIIRRQDGIQILDDTISTTLRNPNQLMTISDLLEYITYKLLTKNNAWILPQWSNNGADLISLFPIDPMTVEFIEDNSGVLYVNMQFKNGYTGGIRYDNLIHIRRQYGRNDFLGGNEQGQADNRAILQSLQMNDDLIQSVGRNLKASSQINGVVKYNTYLDDGSTKENLNKLVEAVKSGESGLLPLDLKAEFLHIPHDTKLIDTETLKFLDRRLLCNYGITREILDGSATKEQLESFYQQTIEPLVVSFSQAFSKALLTDRERNGFKHEIIFKHDLNLFISTHDLIEVARLLTDTGGTYTDEIRGLFGFEPTGQAESKKLVMSKNFGAASMVATTPTGTMQEITEQEDTKENEEITT